VNKYYRQEGEPEGLLVTIPGNHYGVDGPMLYYPSKLLRDAGWDTLALTYGYQSAAIEFGHEAAPGVLQESQEAMQFVLSERSFSRIGLVGKSLGCFVIAQLCSTLEGLRSAKCVYLTPPIGTPFFDQLFAVTSQPAHLAIGTNDRFYSSQALEDLQGSRSFGLTLIEEVDHSMDLAGDLAASLAAIDKITRDVVEFLLEGQ
jgi:hypothetical protein